MTSRPKKRSIKKRDESQTMDVDPTEGNTFSSRHQLFLQYLMHSHMTKKRELVNVHKQLFNNQGLDDTFSEITSEVRNLKMDIKRVVCDLTGDIYYVLIHTTGEHFFPKSCVLNKSQLEFLKQILSGIVLSSKGRVGTIESLNSCKVLSKSDAEDSIELFIRERILIKTCDGVLCLSPLAVVEFEPFFTACFPSDLRKCELCVQLVFVGKICNSCKKKFHYHCVSKWLNSKRSECPKCQHDWAIDMDADTE